MRLVVFGIKISLSGKAGANVLEMFQLKSPGIDRHRYGAGCDIPNSNNFRRQRIDGDEPTIVILGRSRGDYRANDDQVDLNNKNSPDNFKILFNSNFPSSALVIWKLSGLR
jgi:hypothetical protein